MLQNPHRMIGDLGLKKVYRERKKKRYYFYTAFFFFFNSNNSKPALKLNDYAEIQL